LIKPTTKNILTPSPPPPQKKKKEKKKGGRQERGGLGLTVGVRRCGKIKQKLTPRGQGSDLRFKLLCRRLGLGFGDGTTSSLSLVVAHSERGREGGREGMCDGEEGGCDAGESQELDP